MKTIKTKIISLIVISLIGIFLIVNLIYEGSLYYTSKADAEKYMWTQCMESQNRVNEQLQRMEVAVDLIVAHTRYYMHDDEVPLDVRMKKLESSAIETAQYAQNVCSIFYNANQEHYDKEIQKYYDNNYDFYYVFDSGNNMPRQVEPRNPATYEAKTGNKPWWYEKSFENKRACWVEPYTNHIFENGVSEVVAYTVPLTDEQGEIHGIMGMEFSLNMIFGEMNYANMYDDGYMFATDYNGMILYHPKYEYGMQLSDKLPKQWQLVKNLIGEDHPSHLVSYELEGTKRMMAALQLENGMILIVSAPTSEIFSQFTRINIISTVIFFLIFNSVILIGAFIIHNYVMPIKKLSEASQKIMEGDMEIDIEYKGEDEIGILIDNFKKMASNLDERLEEYSTMAYTDAMTRVNNKASFEVIEAVMDNKIQENYSDFGIVVADLNNLKTTNDRYGHTSGDGMIKTAASVISRAFSHSPVFRIGGDEFAVVVEKEDYQKREELIDEIYVLLRELNNNLPPDKRISIACGMAVFQKGEDTSFKDVFERADRMMYDNKRSMKQGR